MTKNKPVNHAGKALDAARARVLRFRADREDAKEQAERIKKEQPSLIDMLREVGIDNDNGLVIDPNDKSKGTAYVQQNKGSTVWDEEAILDWLNKRVAGRKTLLRKSQSLVFDLNKWEALVASKEVKPAVAKKFMKTLDPSAPFIRFGKKGDTSL